MNYRIKLLPLLLSSLLAACVSAPSPRPHVPLPEAAIASTSRPPKADLKPSAPTSKTIESPPEDAGTVWDRLRGSFAMADCEADRGVDRWARRFTRNPRRFESQLKAVLPRLVYVQKVAARYDVPGEFALVPWVESHFQPVAGRRHRPAGMWQIMPITAGAMGLRVDGKYDGRMDIPAAANAVMKLLAQYHHQFQDWRLADYAYNAGEFSIRRIIREHGMPPAKPLVPDWPVHKGTREHLTKLLAIACVVREPSRFNVTLPTLPEEQRLVKVDIPHAMSLSRAADHAGLSVDVLKGFNSAFRDERLDAEAASYLLLPASHAKQFKDATKPPGIAAHDRDAIDGGAKGRAKRTHTVRSGENLSTIARNYRVKVAELKRWNHLSDSMLKPGQILRVDGNR